MDQATIGGLGFASLMVLMGMISNLGAFIDMPSLFITVLGSLGVTVASYRMEEVKNAVNVAKIAFNQFSMDPLEYMMLILELANKARKEGMMALEQEIPNIEDKLIKSALETMMSGVDVDVLKDVLETEIAQIEERHAINKKIFEDWASYAPAFGMIGTLVGLIIMLGQLSDPNALGPAMATAMITTLYGSMIANMLANPIAYKLDLFSKLEVNIKTMVVTGLIALASGEAPAAIEAKLKPFLPPEVRRKFEEEQAAE